MHPAVFLDRDGTINVEKNYVHRFEDFEFIEGSIEAIRMLRDSGFKVVVVTNQSGIGRGYYTSNDVQLLHDRIQRELRKEGTMIDAFFFCPHHPDAPIAEYRLDCECRKPKPGMVFQAEKKLDLDLKRSYIVGDSAADMEMGKQTGLYSILVRTGHGAESLETLKGHGIRPDEVVENLFLAARQILHMNAPDQPLR